MMTLNLFRGQNLFFGQKEIRACINCQYYVPEKRYSGEGRPPTPRGTGCSHPNCITELFDHITGKKSILLDERCRENYRGKCKYYKETTND